MTKRATVTLQGIKCVAVGPDPGSALEIYGDLSAKRTFVNDLGDFEAIEEFGLWHKGPHDWVNIARDNTLSVNETTPVMTIEPGEFLWVGGHLADQDEFPSANDNLGFRENRLSHDQLVAGPQVVTFDEDGQVVEARFNVKLM